MPEITPSFVMQYERNMRAISEKEYVRKLADEHTWWNKVMRTMPIERKTERITWLLETAMIEPVGPTGSGQMEFENLVSQTVEYPTFRHAKGCIIQRDQFEDLDGTGLNEVAAWSEQIGIESAYYPQRLGAHLLLNGANTDGSANAYDSVPFFADNTSNTINGVSVKGHPFNPYRPELGGYKNWLKGASASGYPGALPIDDSVAVDVALVNLGKILAHISDNRMPNGVDPRFLKPAFILAPPRMAPRLNQLLNARFIAQLAGTGSAAGSGDVMATVQGFGLGRPIIAQELAASYNLNLKTPYMGPSGAVKFATESVTGSDTTFYVICQEMKTTSLGGLLHLQRKPFKVNYYTGDSGGTGMQADLDRANQFEYHVQGRMSCAYGHPYTVYRCDGS